MKKSIITNECHCPDVIRLKKELFEKNLIIQELNNGEHPDLRYEQISKTITVMYPVGFAQYKLKMKKDENLIKQLEGLKIDNDVLKATVAAIAPFKGFYIGCGWCVRFDESTKLKHCSRGTQLNFNKCGLSEEPKES